MRLVAFKGATAWEFQVGRVWVKFVHLTGVKWKLTAPLWKRLTIGIDRSSG